MPSPRRISGAVAVLAAVVLLCTPAGAGARAGDKTFAQTFPLASALCARVAAGQESAHLRRFAARVLADCSALSSTFTEAQSRVLAVRAQIEPQLAADRAAVAAACPRPTAVLSRACLRAHRLDDGPIAALAHARLIAVRRYAFAIEAARLRFWRAIRGLPGEHRVRVDRPIPLPSS